MFRLFVPALCIAAFAAPMAHAAEALAPSPAATPTLASRSAPQGPVELSADEMSGVHAGAESKVSVLTNQQVSGVTSGNSITAGTLTSGMISFSPDALNGYSGVGNFVINTGANNTLQGSINISIVTAPAP